MTLTKLEQSGAAEAAEGTPPDSSTRDPEGNWQQLMQLASQDNAPPGARELCLALQSLSAAIDRDTRPYSAESIGQLLFQMGTAGISPPGLLPLLETRLEEAVAAAERLSSGSLSSSSSSALDRQLSRGISKGTFDIAVPSGALTGCKRMGHYLPTGLVSRLSAICLRELSSGAPRARAEASCPFPRPVCSPDFFCSRRPGQVEPAGLRDQPGVRPGLPDSSTCKEPRGKRPCATLLPDGRCQPPDDTRHVSKAAPLASPDGELGSADIYQAARGWKGRMRCRAVEQALQGCLDLPGRDRGHGQVGHPIFPSCALLAADYLASALAGSGRPG